MERVSVSSSNLKSVGYDSGNDILEVEFLNGTIYQYKSVPSKIYDGLLNASSKGQYLNQYVKDGGYSYSRIK